MDAAGAGMAGFGAALILFLMVLAVLWILVPFAIFGVKPLLRQLLAEQRQTNELLTSLRHEAQQTRAGLPETLHRSD